MKIVMRRIEKDFQLLSFHCGQWLNIANLFYLNGQNSTLKRNLKYSQGWNSSFAYMYLQLRQDSTTVKKFKQATTDAQWFCFPPSIQLNIT